MTDIVIRQASIEDAAEIREIYDYYVQKTAISFEYDTPTVEEMQNRIAVTLKKYPYLVAVKEGRIIGYTYAGAFRTRIAYRYSVELSLYLRKDERGNGYGKLLYDALFSRLKAMGYKNAYACITHTDIEDEYLTNASSRFHERQGFALCGTFRRCGNKFDRWYDMVYMEKFL